jgi:hypothetical protein
VAAVFAVAVVPPKLTADVCVPASEPNAVLAVANVAGEVVQLVPFQSSVAPVTLGVDPPKATAAV